MNPLPSQPHPALPQEVLDLLQDGFPAEHQAREERARLLDQGLHCLEAFEPLVQLRLGQLLAPMIRGGYHHLGHGNASAFCREELGISPTRAHDLVALAEGLARRPLLLAPYLQGALPASHALLLLRLDPAGDAAWADRARDLSVQDLRSALAAEGGPGAQAAGERWRVREYDLDADAYALWLAAVELGRRREGRDLAPGFVVEQVLAEFFAGANPAPVATGDARPAQALQRQAGAEPLALFQRNPLAGLQGHPLAATEAPAAEDAQPPVDPALPPLLRAPLPGSPRKLARQAARLLCLEQQTDLYRGRLLRRMQDQRLYRDLGYRSFRDYLKARGVAPSTAFGCAARDKRLDRHLELRQAQLDGRLTSTKVDLLLGLPPRADAQTWIAFAQTRTCRRLEETVEAARVMAAGFPAAWARRSGVAPADDETLLDFRAQANLQSLEVAVDDLARALLGPDGAGHPEGPEGVQTSEAAGENADAALGLGAVQTSESTGETADGALGLGGVQTSGAAAETPDATLATGTLHLRLLLPEGVHRLLVAAEEALRAEAQGELSDEDCLQVLLLVFLHQASAEEQALRRVRRQALEAAGFRCEVPGCTCRTNLHLHHLQRRSQGGSDEPSNLAVLCSAHHLRHVHGGTARVEGREPLARIWDLGLEEGDPWRVYLDERLVDGAALEEEADPDVQSWGSAAGEAAREIARHTPDGRVCEATAAYRALPPAA